MKIRLLLLLSIFGFAEFALADQHACIDEYTAEYASELFKTKKEVIIYCNPCSNHEKIKVKMDSVRREKEPYCYRMVVFGEQLTGDKKGEKVRIPLDLAYTWVNIDGYARNVAIQLGLPVIDVGEPFDWKTYKLYQAPKAKKKQYKELFALRDSLAAQLVSQNQSIISNAAGERFRVDSFQLFLTPKYKWLSFDYRFNNTDRRVIQLTLDQEAQVQIDGRPAASMLYFSGLVQNNYYENQILIENPVSLDTQIRMIMVDSEMILRQINRMIELFKEYQFD